MKVKELIMAYAPARSNVGNVRLHIFETNTGKTRDASLTKYEITHFKEIGYAIGKAKVESFEIQQLLPGVSRAELVINCSWSGEEYLK